MDKDALNKISINELYEIVIKKTNELIELNPNKDQTEFEAKKNELQLLQRVIVAKRSEFPPYSSY